MFRPRAAVFHRERDLRTTVLGHEISMPVIVSSVGFLSIGHPDGEAGVARAKAEVFDGLEHGGVAVLNADNRWFGLLKGAAEKAGAEPAARAGRSSSRRRRSPSCSSPAPGCSCRASHGSSPSTRASVPTTR
jgi:UDP-N-acetylmuramyl pentapeptide synthase